MARYEVTAPDGSRYEVNAPDTASEAQVMAYAKRQFQQQSKPAPKKERSIFSRATDRAANMFTFGLADDVAGLGTAAANALVAPFSDRVDFDPAGAFRRGKEEFQEGERSLAREAPAVNALATGVGIAGNIAMPTRTLAGATSLGQATRMAAKQGGISGFIGGVGASDGPTEERLASGGIGAAGGAALGAALPVAGRVIGQTYRGVRNLAGKGPSGVAPKLIAEALEADGLTPRAAGEIVDAAQARGVPLALSDVGDNVRGMAASVGRQPGPSRTIVRDMAVGRQEAQADRLVGAVTRDLGPVANIRETGEQLIQQARTTAAPLYEAAYARPAPVNKALDTLLDRPSMRQAMNRAAKIAAEEGRDPRALGFDLNDLGEVAYVRKPSWQTLDYIKRGLDDVIESSRDAVTGRLKLDEGLRAVNNTQRQFLTVLDRLNPDYAAARAAYAGPAKLRTAMEKGKKALTRPADEIAAMTRDLTEAEAEQFRLGIRAAMVDMIENKGDYADKVNALVGTPKKRAVLNRLFGGRGDFDRFLQTLGDERRAQLTYGAVAGNSATAGRLADDAITGNSGLVDAAGDAVLSGSGGWGGLLSAVRRAVSEARGNRVGKLGEEVRGQLAAALSETDPEVLRRALREANRARAAARAGSHVQGAVATVGGRASGLAASQASNALLAPPE